MIKPLAAAIDAIHHLPEPVQDEIGQSLLDYLDALGKLQAAIRLGDDQLARGDGLELTAESWAELRQTAESQAHKK